MKQWKTIAIVICVMLWIVLLIYVVKMPKGQSVAPANQVQLSIDDLETIAERERLVTEILTLRYEAALIQSKFQPAPKPATPAPAPVVPTD